MSQQRPRPGSTMYRCRLCQKVYSAFRHADASAVVATMKDGPLKPSLHDCSDKMVGISEFVGVWFDQPASSSGDEDGSAVSP